MEQNKRNTLKIIGVGAVASTLPTTNAVAGDKPKRGGTIRFAGSGGSADNNFDPTRLTGFRDAHYFLIYNKLVQNIAETGELKPELATSWESKNQNKTWIVNLRKGVKFNDGTEFNADDAIYSFKLHIKKGSKSPGKTYFSDLKEMKKTSKYQIKFEFNNSNPDLPEILALYYFCIVKNGHSDWLKPNGTGGYEITKFNPGVKIVAKRRADYWRDDSAWADEIQVINIDDATSKVNALLSGSVDFVTDIPTNIIGRLKNVSKLNIVESPGKSHITYPMIQTSSPFDDENVRMALKYAIDREKLVKVGMNGYGEIGNDNPISTAYSEYVKQKQISYDTDKAKFYLKKAGLSKLNLELFTSSGAVSPASEKGAIIYSETAKNANINIKVSRVPSDGYWSKIWMKKPFTSSKWSGRPTATIMFDTAYVSGAKWNESSFKRASFDKLILSAKSSASASDRKAKLGEAQRIITEQGSVIIPVFNVLLEASNKRIGGHTKTKFLNINNGYYESFWVK